VIDRDRIARATSRGGGGQSPVPRGGQRRVTAAGDIPRVASLLRSAADADAVKVVMPEVRGLLEGLRGLARLRRRPSERNTRPTRDPRDGSAVLEGTQLRPNLKAPWPDLYMALVDAMDSPGFRDPRSESERVELEWFFDQIFGG
jgi:hypothetical protein